MESLSPEEARVLGCLIEKEATTPDAYPLTMNALLLACNQTSNRTPVVSYDADLVNATLLQLRERKMARVVHSAHGSRVPKYRHALGEVWAITQAELAVLAVLLLRGPQTVNELGTRTERYRADLGDLGGVQGVLDRLAAMDDPLATCLGRQPGQREERWAQLLAGEVETRSETGPETRSETAYRTSPSPTPTPSPTPSPSPKAELPDRDGEGAGDRTYPRPAAATEEVRRLREELDQLRQEVEALRREVDRLSDRPRAD
jgi:uncharacterized protein